MGETIQFKDVTVEMGADLYFYEFAIVVSTAEYQLIFSLQIISRSVAT